MLLKIAMLLLAARLLGVIGVYSAGDRVPVLLLVGLMLLSLGFVRARDAAIAAAREVDRRSKSA